MNKNKKNRKNKINRNKNNTTSSTVSSPRVISVLTSSCVQKTQLIIIFALTCLKCQVSARSIGSKRRSSMSTLAARIYLGLHVTAIVTHLSTHQASRCDWSNDDNAAEAAAACCTHERCSEHHAVVTTTIRLRFNGRSTKVITVGVR